MLGAAVLALLLQIGAPATTQTGSTVHGVVRAEVTGEPVAGARVALPDAASAAVADSAGAYELRRVPSGTHTLRVTAPGYDTARVIVLLADGAPLRLDIMLTRPPVRLTPMKVLARAAGAGDARTWSLGEGPSAGAWSVSGEDLREAPALADVDAFRLLATAPQAQVMVESQAAVHVRGGSADQNLFLLDGAPIYSPVHPGPLLSAVSPDIVEGIVLHGAAPPARYGGRLSSVLDIRTAAAPPDSISVRGGFGPTALRGAAAVPLLSGRAALLVGGRHSYSGLGRSDDAEASMPGAWSDLFGKVALRLAGGQLSLSSFSTGNTLGFAASTGAAAEGDTSARRARNSFAWSSATRAASWRGALGGAALEARLWDARFEGDAGWSAESGALALRSTLRDAGAAGAVAWTRGSRRTVAGAELRRLTTRYDVAQRAAGSDTLLWRDTLLRRDARPALGSIFVEERWQPLESWTIDAGLRGTWMAGGAARLEPRLSISVRPSPRLEVAAGYARLHQYDQSLRNEESLLGAIAGPDLPVAAGAPGVPVARSDELTASAVLALDPRTRIDIGWYARRMYGLALAAPVTTAPFATREIAVGQGRAWGLGVSVRRNLDRLDLEGSYAFGVATRHAAGVRYRPTFAPIQSASAAAGYALGPRTRLRSAVWLTAGRLTTLIGDDVGWDTRDALSGARELSGTPEHAAGPLAGAHLPPYLRLDVGIRHTMAVTRARGLLTGFASLNNALERENEAALVAPPGSSRRRALVMLPLSFSLGLEWRY